jgi:hypothetical protein
MEMMSKSRIGIRQKTTLTKIDIREWQSISKNTRIIFGAWGVIFRLHQLQSMQTEPFNVVIVVIGYVQIG